MKKGNRWKDHYTEKAREESWLARSVYKLEEIDKKYKLIKQGSRILDLGCYPGSWSQYCLKQAGQSGKVVGIDLQRPGKISSPHFRFFEGDIMTVDPITLSCDIGAIDLVISDLAPQTTGNTFTDVCMSMTLVEKALEVAVATLKKGGHFICKVFEGEDFKAFRDKVSVHFDQTKILRPQAVRKRSREVYLIGMNFKSLPISQQI